MKNPLKNLFGFGSKSAQQPSRTRLQLEELEARVLYSASPAPTGEPGDVDIEPDAVSYEEHTVVESQSGQPAPVQAPSQDTGWGQVAAVSAPEGAETPAEEQGEQAPAAALTPEILQSTVEAAKARWQDSGLTPDQAAALDALEFQIANLGEGELARVEGNTVLIDADAAGNGWFIDATPLQDEEYADGRGTTAGSILGVDLLSAILHEQGHALGLHHDTDPTDGRDVMYGSLGIGERRVPLAGFAEGAVPQTITQAEMLLFDTQSKITASDGGAFDEFGYAVAIDGDTAVIGAQGDDDRGANAGAAYIYKLEGGVWTFKAKLAPADLLANEGFGRSVAISGNDVVVGVPLSGGFPPIGHAYVFNRDQGGSEAWGQVARIQSLDRAASDNFGWSVDVEGDFIIVGARREDSAPLTDNGAAYIFARNQGGANAWGQTAKLTAATPQGNALFGDSVALTGNAVDGYTAVVGASGYNNGATIGAGAAFIFQFNGSSWTQTNILRASDPRAAISFGLFVDISGNTVIVGAPGDDPVAGTNAGSAYIFERNQGGTNAWGQVKKLAASDASANSAFGSSVGISGDNIMVGASGKSASYIFGRNEGGSGQWGQITRLAPADAAGDQFGFAAAIDGTTAIVGANFDDDRGTSSGSAFFYQSTVAPVGETTVGLDANGNLLIQSTTGDSDSITLKIEGGNVRISDPTNTLTAGAGAAQDGSDVLVSLASITGSTGIIIDTQGGGDTLTIDFSGGLFSKAISFLGGNPTVAPGDSLVLTGGSFASAVYNFVNASSGSILLSGNAAITYSGLEPVTSTITVTDVTLNYTGGTETITVSNPGIPGQTRVASTLGETLTFVNPTNSLTINAGTGNDTINVQGVGSGFAADLFVNGDDGVDVVRFQTVATNTSGGDISAAAESIAVTAAVNAGGGTITFLANGGTGTGIAISNDVITSASGNIILIGAGGSTAGSDGVNISGVGTDVTVVNGNITITGTSINDDGVEITALVRATGTGSVGIEGTTTVTALATAQGVTVNTISGSVTTAGGNLEIEGQSSGGEGIQILLGNVQTTLSGALTLTGAGTAGSGVVVNTSPTGVRAQNGDLSITGTSSTSDGIRIANGTVQTSGTGDVILHGTNLGGTENGVDINSVSTVRTLGGGDLIVEGSSAARDGVTILGSQVNTAGAGNLSITGSSSGTTLAAGVSFISNSNVRTENGLLRVEGMSANERGILVSVSTLQTTGTGDIELDGTGGSGAGDTGITLGTAQILTAGGDITLEGTGADHGLSLAASTIAAGTVGNVTIRGTSTGSFNNAAGVQINSAPPGVTVVSSVDGNIDVTGTSQGVTSTGNYGILLSQGRIESTGAGNVSLTGTGAGVNGDGVNISTTGQVNSVNGDVSIVGTSTADEGVELLGVVRSTGTGSVTMEGTTTSTFAGSGGLLLNTASSQVITNSGDVRLEGTAVNGIGLQTTTGGVTSAGGDITLEGLSTGATGAQVGNVVTALAGSLSITGTGASAGVAIGGATGLRTEDGNIVVTGTGGTGDGIFVSNTSVASTGAGDITLQGSTATGIHQGIDITIGALHSVRSNGGDITMVGTSGASHAVLVVGSSTVSTTEAGTVSLTGTATGATAIGVNIFNSAVVRTENGQISLEGSATGNDGVSVSLATVQTTGTGGISMVGTGGSTAASHNGVSVTTGTLSSGGGDIDITGTSGGTGVFLGPSTISAAGAGNITMNGTANGDFTDAHGVAALSATTSITSMDGNISLTGVTNATTTVLNNGVFVNTTIASSGTGNIALDGTGGGSNGDGVSLTSASVLNTASGNISLTGTSTSDDGVQVVGGTVSAGGAGDVDIAGIGGNRLDAIGAVVANGGEVRSVDGNISISGQSLEDDGVQILDGQVIVSGTGSIVIDGVTTGAELFDEGVSVVNAGAEVSTTSGSITFTGQSNAGRGLLVSLGTVRTTGGEIVVDADEIIVGGTGVVFDAASGNITMNAEEDITLTGVSSTGLVSLTTTGGAILDGGEGQTDITAGQLLISAPGGFGTEATPLETDIDNMEGDAGSGGIYLTNTGNLTIGGAGAANGLTTTGDVAITVNSGSLTVSEGLSAGGDIDLTAAAVTGHGITITSDLGTTGAGNITLHGTGGSGATDSGVRIQGSGTEVSAVDGNISITGISSHEDGVEVLEAQVRTTGAGSITLDGASTTADLTGQGVAILGPTGAVTTAGGNLSIEGETTGSEGILLSGGSLVATTQAGAILLAGIGRLPGVNVNNTGANGVRTEDGDIVVTGSSTTNDGVRVSGGSVVSTGAGDISLDGDSTGTVSATGVDISLSSLVQAASGQVSIEGTTTGDNGVLVTSLSAIEGGSVAITATGTGGTSFGMNVQSGAQLRAQGDLSIVGSSVNADGVFFSGGSAETTGTGGTGGLDNGIALLNSQLQAAAGNLGLTGTSGDSGILLDGSLIAAGGAGNVSLQGTAGNVQNADGITQLDDATITSVDGTISFTGNSLGTTQTGNNGVSIDGRVEATGLGGISLDGIAGGTLGHGILLGNPSNLITAQGDITMTGATTTDDGIQIAQGAVQAGGGGSVTLTGTSTAANGGVGVFLVGAEGIRTVDGDIDITGHSTGAAGVSLASFKTLVSGAGSVSIQGTSTGADGFDHGVSISSNLAEVSTTVGAIDILGTASGGNGVNLQTAVIHNTGSADITITG